MEVVEGCLDSRLAEFIVELRDLKDEVATGRQERQLLIEENKELKAHIMYLEKLADNNEQYSRRNCLVLSGEDLPRPSADESGEQEEPAQTRKIVEDVIKNKLGVKLSEKNLACHRLLKKR